MAKAVFTCFHILKPTMNKWAQYPAQMEVKIEPYSLRILRALGDALFRQWTQH